MHWCRLNLAFRHDLVWFHRQSMVVVLIIGNLRTGAILQLSPMRDVTKSRPMSLNGTAVDFAGHIVGTISKLASWLGFIFVVKSSTAHSIELLHMIQCCWFGIVTMEAVLCWLHCAYQSWIMMGINRPALVKMPEKFSSRIFQIFTILD